MKHRPEKTAIYSTSPSNATRKLATDILARRELKYMPTVLDFGAGNGRNTLYLREETDALVFPYDPLNHPKSQVNLFRDLLPLSTMVFDYILYSFVINVLPPTERQSVVKELQNLNWKNLIMEVRTHSNLESLVDPRPFKDGVITQRHTYQRVFQYGEIIVEDYFNGNVPLKYTENDRSLSVIYKR